MSSKNICVLVPSKQLQILWKTQSFNNLIQYRCYQKQTVFILIKMDILLIIYNILNIRFQFTNRKNQFNACLFV